MGSAVQRVTKSNYLDAVQNAFAPIVRDYSLVLADHQYSSRSFGNFLVHYQSPVVELRIVRDRDCCELEVRPSGSTSSDDWIADGFLLQLLGDVEAGDAMNRSTRAQLSELAAAIVPLFDRIVRLFDPSNVKETYERVRALYARNAERLGIVVEQRG